MIERDTSLKPGTEKLVVKPLSAVIRNCIRGAGFGRSVTAWCGAVVMATSGGSLCHGADEAKGPSPAMVEAIQKVEATGASLLPIASGVSSYRFTALNVAKEFGDAGLDALLPVADSIVSLDLARTQVTDAGLAKVAKMSAL